MQAPDSSGYVEEIKDKSANTAGDSYIIPESTPPSADTTLEEESFNIPETQAVSFTRSSKCHDMSKISCDDDFVIPETQAMPFTRTSRGQDERKMSCDDEFLIPETQCVLEQRNERDIVRPEEGLDIVSDDDASELGTQIRICTQEFNEFNEDAIDDFDSSLLLGDDNVTSALFGRVNPKKTQGNYSFDTKLEIVIKLGLI